MNENQMKKVIIVLSPGRSGSSLLMKVLGSLGMNLSGGMIPGSKGNPEGFFEDVEIVNVHKEILEKNHTRPTLPMPDGWLESESAKRGRRQLRKILEKNLAEADTIWGFKDPRTVSLLPLWSRILNAPGILPVFILAVRDPSAVAISLKQQIGRAEIITELQWLQRTCDALHNTAADCFIVHYEDWFKNPVELASGLLSYTGLDKYFKGDLPGTLKGMIKQNLNRSVYEKHSLQNDYVRRLYDILRQCCGSEFDRTELMDTVKVCRRALEGFKGWAMEATSAIQLQSNFQQRLKDKASRPVEVRERLDRESQPGQNYVPGPKFQTKEGGPKRPDNNIEKLKNDLQVVKTQKDAYIDQIEAKNQHLEQLENDLQKIIEENSEYIKQIKDLHDKSEILETRITAYELEKSKQTHRRQENRPDSKEVTCARQEKSASAKSGQQRPAEAKLIRKLKREIIQLRHSYSFRLGKIFTNALLKPGKNTLFMPYYLVVLAWDIVSKRGRTKVKKALAEGNL